MTPIEVEQARKLVRALMAPPMPRRPGAACGGDGGARRRFRRDWTLRRPGAIWASPAPCAPSMLCQRKNGGPSTAWRRPATTPGVSGSSDSGARKGRQRWYDCTARLVRPRQQRQPSSGVCTQTPKAPGSCPSSTSGSRTRPPTRRGVGGAETWIWLGGYVESLAPVVETYLNSTDTAERLHAFNKLDKYRSKRSDGDYSDAKKAWDALERLETPHTGARSGHEVAKAGRRDPDTVRAALEVVGRVGAARPWKNSPRRRSPVGPRRPRVRGWIYGWIYSPKPYGR